MSLPLLLSILCFSLLQSPTLAIKKTYIVYLGTHAHGPQPTSVELDSVTNSHYKLLGSYLGSTEEGKNAIMYSYKNVINGFAAVLDEEKAAEIAKHPEVISVFPNRGRKLHTTRSWDFMRLERNGVIPKASLWMKARFGEDTIIGNLDTGVWPESKSFSDEGMGPVPSRWRGICQKGVLDRVRCNRKLIGVRYFNKGFAEAAGGALNSTYNTARDHEGHGTHTLSTAAGSFVPEASVFGHGNGTAKGGSPRARVAAYKVCWPPINGNECFEADILAGFDAAISDGVDVLSVSLGGEPIQFLVDGIAIGSLHAVQRGILVVSSAGNSGPGLYTVSNVAPWMLTVGASTLDRHFTSYVAIGNREHFKGASLSPKILPSQKFYPLISAADAKASNAYVDDAKHCAPGSLDSKKVTGKIVACLRGGSSRINKGQQVLQAGGVGMILANDQLNGNELLSDIHVLPASHISYSDGQALFNYTQTAKNPVAYLTSVRTELGVKPAPVIASFSSRGPNAIVEELLKPDIIAPGVDIIAAFTEAVSPSDLPSDNRRTPFNVESGTSMSCPHVAGIAGLLKTLHPDWSGAAIKSAIMTTARTRDNSGQPMRDSSKKQATPFDYGAGHVRPNSAMDPGLVYDLTIDDYLNFLCAHGYNDTQIGSISRKPYKCPKSVKLEDFNYPSISVPYIRGSTTITRKLKNVGSPGTYRVRIKSPKGVSVSVKPKKLEFCKTGEEKIFQVTFKSKVKGEPISYVFGQLIWSDGKHYVRSPLVVKDN